MGRADLLVSGDADLQALHPFENARILSPASFLERLSRATPASPAETPDPQSATTNRR